MRRSFTKIAACAVFIGMTYLFVRVVPWNQASYKSQSPPSAEFFAPAVPGGRDRETRIEESPLGLYGEGLMQGGASEVHGASEQGLVRIPLAPELQGFRNGPVGQAHERLERELVDPLWSTAMELRLTEFLSEEAESIGDAAPRITCRSTMCEIQIVAYNKSGMDTAKWLTLLNSRLYGRTWAGEMYTSGLASGEKDDVATVLWFLARR